MIVYRLQMDVVEEPIHGGTHFDAPIHFNKDGWDVSQVPLEMMLFVPVARVDVRHKVASNPAYLLTVDDILDWEKEHARLPDGCLFIAHTGHSKVHIFVYCNSAVCAYRRLLIVELVRQNIQGQKGSFTNLKFHLLTSSTN